MFMCKHIQYNMILVIMGSILLVILLYWAVSVVLFKIQHIIQHYDSNVG